MRQESNHRTNSGKDNRISISNSRAMGVIVLIALLFVFQVTTFVVHKVRVASGEVEEKVHPEGAGSRTVERFPFNPNTISKDSLQLLGFTSRQAQSIINYREKGGKFRKREDFAKLYVVDSTMYHSLVPYILLPDRYALPAEVGERKNAVPGTKRVAESDFVQIRTDSSTKLDGGGRMEEVVTDGGRDTGHRGRDTLYGHKVAQNRYMCNLNTADSAALVQLYGIGGYYARKILKYREQLGGSFVSPRQLLEIEGFTWERYSKIEKHIFVGEEDIKGFSILGADRKTLERHPYIGPYAARGILTYLRVKGIPETGAASAGQNCAAPKPLVAAEGKALAKQVETEQAFLKELVKERILTPENARKLEEYLLHL